MGLSRWLARAAVTSPCVLLVETVDGWVARVRVEQEIVRRGWRCAASPAGADILAVCGRPTAAEANAIERTWEQLPGPRSRADIGQDSPTLIATALDDALDDLLDDRAQVADADERAPMPEGLFPEDSGDDSEGGHHDHGHMDHGHMDHGHMDMTGPGGIALASGGPDRDGLQMDVLHLRLGPVLAHWPAGLVLNLSLQGDVVADAQVETVPDRPDRGRVRSAAESVGWRCDAVSVLLVLAGCDGQAASVRQIRDRALGSPTAATTADAVESLRRRVARSPMLRWSLRNLAPASESPASEATVPLLAGDVYDRLLRLFDVAVDEARTGTVANTEPVDLANTLPPLVIGTELATVRLAVASVAGFMAAPLQPTVRAGQR